MQWTILIKVLWGLIFLGIAVLSGFTLAVYSGSPWIYLLFTVLSTVVLFSGFGGGAIFFDAFVGVLLWIGFWLKFSVRTAFLDGNFKIPVGGFDGSPAALDRTLLVVCCALIAILLARFIRQRYVFTYPNTVPEITYVGLFEIYRKYRFVLLLGFILAVLSICLSNAWLGIYQRGLVARTTLPFGINGIYAWLLMFGMASVSALILRFEFELNRDRYWIAITIALLESALSCISLWSRGMILNSSSLLYGAISLFRRDEPRMRVGLASFAILAFLSLFVISVLSVNWLRANAFYNDSYIVKELMAEDTKVLFLDRWVGVEGVMSVVGAPRTGWAVLGEALSERFDTSTNSFYDLNFIATTYDNQRDDSTHFVSLPGYIAFLFYPGSYAFLFFAVFLFSTLAGFVEYFVYRTGGKNLVFCALIAQVVAFRYTSFGYVPMQSYMLFGSILLNVLILYFSDKLVRIYFKI